jgi:hypothetical protein
MNFPNAYAASVSIPFPADEDSRVVFESISGRPYDPDSTLNAIRMFTGTEGMFAGVVGMTQKIFGPEGINDAKRRQMIGLRVAKGLNAPYEWQAQAVIGKNTGLSDEEITAAASDFPVAGIDPEYVLICRATDELTLSKTLTDETLTELLNNYGDVATRKHILTIAYYNMLGLWLNGCRVPLETTDKVGGKTSPLE